MELQFPVHGDPKFREKLMKLDEYRLFAQPSYGTFETADAFEETVQQACGGFEKMMYQHLMQHYLSRRSPYRSLLLYHGLGVGKTCSSITIAEAFLTDHTASDEPRILVVSPTTLKKSYEDQIFSATMYLNKKDLRNQCTSDTYAKLVHGNPEQDVFVRRVQQIIKSRYTFLTYDRLVSYAETHPHVRDKIIIVDEAHNLRQQETEKKAAEALETILRKGERNRLVLLSATPMYNEPDEILWLLSLLLLNDHREKEVKLPKTLFDTHQELKKEHADQLSQLASEYVSYIRGKNPFTFAVRMSPRASGFSTLTNSWAQPISDGIIPSPIGKSQKMGKSNDMLTSPKSAQWMNITYPDGGHGETGFWKVFRTDASSSQLFPVSYRENTKNALMPNMGLQDVAAKMNTICNILQKSEGIVLVYSQFVWSGVLPLAVALEHMGFRRVVGGNGEVQNIVDNIEHVSNPITYPGIPFPKYCILSGDVNVMGSSRIETLRKYINQAENQHGEKVKVVLITPIAGEGLSFQNVREVHILDPWYHMNRTEQVVGRAIRTCSHVSLPLEERNVSVFLHACVSSVKDTTDIHTYKIAARKLYQTSLVERLIRDHAMDCSLQYNLNYQPKSMFGFQVAMRTSQQAILPHSFGDSEEYRPQCSPPVEVSSETPMRVDMFTELVPTIIHRIRRYVQKQMATKLYFSQEELIKAGNTRREIVFEALRRILKDSYWIPNQRLLAHRNGFILVANQTSKPQYEIVLSDTEPVETQPTASLCDASSLLSTANISDSFVATILLYQAIDSTCWDAIAREVIADQENFRPILDIMAKYGSFIKRRELPRFASKAQGDYIGYVHILPSSIEAPMQIWLLNSNGEYVQAAESDVNSILKKRKAWQPPQGALYGILQPTKFSKDANAPYRNTLKVMLPDPTVGKRRGVVCTSNRKGDIMQWLQQLGHPTENQDQTKDQLCFTLSLELLRKGGLYIYPGQIST